MKIILYSAFFAVYINICFAQKPPLDYSAAANFPEILSTEISNDGKYVLYAVNNKKLGSSLFIQSSANTFKKEITGPADFFLDASFSEDSRRVIFMKPGDSLCIIDLPTNHELYIPHCQSFMMPGKGNGEWLAYQLTSKELVLYNLFSGEKKQYPKVGKYLFSEGGKILLVENESNLDSSKVNTLQWVDLRNGNTVSIWHGVSAGSFVFDQMETQVAFIAEASDQRQVENTIWYYQMSMDSARLWVDSRTIGLERGFAVKNGGLQFSPDGQKVFFNIYQQQVIPKPDPESASVDVWSYKDQFLQPEQLANLESNNNRSFRAVINLKDNKVIRLEQEKDGLGGRLNEGGNDDHLLIETKVNSWEGYRLPNERPDIYLVSTKDGSRKCIRRKVLDDICYFSPGGKYVYWYDHGKRAYFTYDIQNGSTKNVNMNIPVVLFDELWDLAASPRPYGMAAWLQDDEAILVYDRYDIWQVDPAGIRPPVNITNGYGRKKKIILRYVNKDGNVIDNPAVSRDASLILCALSEENKYNGFFGKKLNERGDPVQLTLSPKVYYFPDIRFVSFSTFLLKAKQADIYLLKRMSATEYPNLQITKDFIEFRAVSELQPQKVYNWLTSELVHWKTFDGRPGAGILYKPGNFDPQKKHPIIFYFYDRLSDGLNRFIKPGLSEGDMNISFFASQGYLVFCPDIHFTVGEPGGSVYNYVVSAARMMSQKPWVNGKRMGIQGHSLGGYEVNYLITRTELFAAAASAAGFSDLVSDYGTLKLNTKEAQGYIERGPYRMGVTLWQNQATYIRNSPLLGADKVISPLLIMHNKKDDIVSWSQSVEFFTALRRLGKRVWMLQYDNGYHILLDEKDKLDYSTRLCQFFDHYLKGMPAPTWMSAGIPASRKGIDTGLELDSSGAIP